MEGAFTHLGNHLLSDSAAAIKADETDELSNIDPDESLLFGKLGGGAGLGNARRRNDDDDNETEVYDDEDDESLASVPVDGLRGLSLKAAEEEKELPAHACVYVHNPLTLALGCPGSSNAALGTAVSTPLPPSSSAWHAASGSAAPEETLRPRT